MSYLKEYWRLLLIWAAAIVLTAWVVADSKSFQSCIQQGEYDAAQQTLEKSFANLSLSITRHKDCVGVFVDKNHAALTALATLFLMLFTLTLWWSTRGLLKAGERHAERQLRAYIVVRGGFIQYFPLSNQLRAHVKIVNSGQTPAYSAGTVHEVQLGPPSNFDFKESKVGAKSIVGPREEINLDTVWAIAESDLIKVREKTLAIYLWGYIEYLDAFERRWRFTFRCRMMGPQGDLGSGAVGWALGPDPSGYQETQIKS